MSKQNHPVSFKNENFLAYTALIFFEINTARSIDLLSRPTMLDILPVLIGLKALFMMGIRSRAVKRDNYAR